MQVSERRRSHVGSVALCVSVNMLSEFRDSERQSWYWCINTEVY